MSTNEQEQQIEAYLKSLTKKEYKAYEIAKSHLGTSFDIKKGNGFLEWLKKYNSQHCQHN